MALKLFDSTSGSGWARLRVLLVLVTLPVLAGASDVWVWIDDNGVTNYTQQRPKDRQATLVTASSTRPADQTRAPGTTSPSTALEADRPPMTAEQQATLDKLKAEQREQDQRMAAELRQNCERARTRLTNLIQNARVRIQDEDGTEHAIGENERQRQIRSAQEQIARNCSDVG